MSSNKENINSSMKKTQMPNTYGSLKAAVDKSDTETFSRIVKDIPYLLRAPKMGQNILSYACLQAKTKMVTFILKMLLDKSSSEHKGNGVETDAFIECIRFERTDMIKLMVGDGFDLTSVPSNKREVELSYLDYSILGGHYEIAHFIHRQLPPKLRVIRPLKDYLKIGKKYAYRYVNYEMLIAGLTSGTTPEAMGNYLRKPGLEQKQKQVLRLYEETCWDSFMRIMGFRKTAERAPGKAKDKISDEAVTSTGEKQTVQTDRPLVIGRD